MVEWSVAAAAIAFIVLAAGMLIAIRTMLVRLARMQASAEAMQADMHRLSAEISAVLKPAEETLLYVQQGIQSADGLFQAASRVSGTIEHTAAAAQRVTATLSDSAVKHAERLAASRHMDEAVQWAELGLTAWQLWLEHRKSSPDSESIS